MNSLPIEIGVFTAVVVAVFITLDRMGFKFVREKSGKTDDSPKVIIERSECPGHKGFMECLTKIKTQQATNVEKLKNHEGQLKDGRVDFDKVYDKLETMGEDISQLCRDVAVIAAVEKYAREFDK